jgi:hypothetical protein
MKRTTFRRIGAQTRKSKQVKKNADEANAARIKRNP